MDKTIYNSTDYYVWQYNEDGEQNLWQIFNSKKELNDFRLTIINSGSDVRVEKRVTRTTDITKDFFKTVA